VRVRASARGPCRSRQALLRPSFESSPRLAAECCAHRSPTPRPQPGPEPGIAVPRLGHGGGPVTPVRSQPSRAIRRLSALFGETKPPAVRSPTLGLHFLPHSAANRAGGPWLWWPSWPCAGEDDHRQIKSGQQLLFLFFSPSPFSPASHLSDGGAAATTRGGWRRDGGTSTGPLASARARSRLSTPLSNGLAVAPPDPSSKRGQSTGKPAVRFLPTSQWSGGAIVFPRHGGVDCGRGARVGPSPLSFLLFRVRVRVLSSSIRD
jgi:hypothetical protein